MKKIVFRADAKPSLGIGDLMSLANLSKYFEAAGWQAHFIVKDHKAAVGLLDKHNMKNRLLLDGDVPVKQEVSLINDYVSMNDIDAIMFQITERKLTEYSGIAGNIIKSCVNFDGIIPEGMDLVINWDVNANSIFDTVKYPGTKFLLGPEYVILPLDFDFTRIGNRAYKAKPETMLIAMGGADELNFTEKVVSGLIKNRVDLKLNIIVGSGYQYLENLKDKLADYNAGHVIKQNINNMFNEYVGCDMAIGAGGLTAFELIATRTPSFLIAIYEHQVPRCIYFDKTRWARYMGYRTFDDTMLAEGLKGQYSIPPKNIFKTDQIRKAVDELFERR